MTLCWDGTSGFPIASYISAQMKFLTLLVWSTGQTVGPDPERMEFKLLLSHKTPWVALESPTLFHVD